MDRDAAGREDDTNANRSPESTEQPDLPADQDSALPQPPGITSSQAAAFESESQPALTEEITNPSSPETGKEPAEENFPPIAERDANQQSTAMLRLSDETFTAGDELSQESFSDPSSPPGDAGPVLPRDLTDSRQPTGDSIASTHDTAPLSPEPESATEGGADGSSPWHELTNMATFAPLLPEESPIPSLSADTTSSKRDGEDGPGIDDAFYRIGQSALREIRELPFVPGSESGGSPTEQLVDVAAATPHWSAPDPAFSPVTVSSVPRSAAANGASVGKERLEVEVEVTVANIHDVARISLEDLNSEFDRVLDAKVDPVRLEWHRFWVSLCNLLR